MTNPKIAPWPAGIDMLSEVTALPEGAVRDALNGVFVKGGAFIRRDGETSLNQYSTHSVFTASTGVTYCVQGVDVGTLSQSGEFTTLGTLPDPRPGTFTEINDTVVFSSNGCICKIADGGVSKLGVEIPQGFTAKPYQTGGLQAGTYGVAVSCYGPDGEEGGLAPVMFVTLAEGQGINVTLPTVLEDQTSGFNIYRTLPDSSELYAAVKIPLLSSYIIGEGQLGATADTINLVRMPPGRFARYWQGRLLVARGRTLVFSEPFSYGLANPRHGFIQTPSEIAWLEAIPSGVFVGTREQTYFLDGATPADWRMRAVDKEPSLFGASALVSVRDLDSIKLPQGVDYIVVWLATGGFYLGLPQGAVLRPQADRIKLDLRGQDGSLAVAGGVLTAIIQ